MFSVLFNRDPLPAPPPAVPTEQSTDDAAAPGPRRITWVPPDGFLGLSLLNGLLRVLTLGVYHFWGKTEARRCIWAAVRIDGEPLEYRGTGGELCRGFIIVLVLILLPLGIAAFLPMLWGASFAGNFLFQIAIYFVPFALGGFGMFRARRYRLSRTRWRGVRGGLSGRTLPFAWTYIWTTALIPLTLGWIVPWRAARLQRALFNGTRFGDKAFTFSGQSGPLYKRFWLVWFSAIVLYVVAIVAVAAVFVDTLEANMPPPGGGQRPLSYAQIASLVAIGLLALLLFAMIRAWYSSRMFNYFASQTRYHGCGFRLNTTVASLVWLAATNFLMRVLSLGVLSPIAEARAMRYMVERLSIEGAVDWAAVGQNPDALLARGEGLAEAFDVDAF